MTTSIILAGFGGQGILFAGKQLAVTGMYTNKKITWLPSYGPEMKGGTANCTVIISDNEIGSPITPNPDILIVLNIPSYIKFEPKIKKGGILFADSSLINIESEREDIKKFYIPATSLAQDNDMQGNANVILLGKCIKESNLFTLDELIMSMEKSIPASKKALLEKNIKAHKIGYDF